MSQNKSPLLALDDGTQNVMLDLIGVARNNMNAPLETPGKAVTRVLRESVRQERPVVYNEHQAIKYGVLGGEVSDRYDIDQVIEEADMISFKCDGSCGDTHAPVTDDMRGESCGMSTCDGEWNIVEKVWFGNEVNFSDE